MTAVGIAGLISVCGADAINSGQTSSTKKAPPAKPGSRPIGKRAGSSKPSPKHAGYTIALKTFYLGRVEVEICDYAVHWRTDIMDFTLFRKDKKTPIMLMSREQKSYRCFSDKDFVNKTDGFLNRKAFPIKTEGWVTDFVSTEPGPEILGHKTLRINTVTSYKHKPGSDFNDQLYVLPECPLNKQEIASLSHTMPKALMQVPFEFAAAMPIRYEQSRNKRRVAGKIVVDHMRPIDVVSIEKTTFDEAHFLPAPDFTVADSDTDFFLPTKDAMPF